MILACVTTAIALTAGSANFFERLTKGKLGYIEGVISVTLVSVILSITGVDAIIDYAAGLLNFIYPVTLVLILSVLLFGGTIKSQKPYFITLIVRSEEHTSELQSRPHLVCRLLLEKK